MKLSIDEIMDVVLNEMSDQDMRLKLLGVTLKHLHPDVENIDEKIVNTKRSNIDVDDYLTLMGMRSTDDQGRNHDLMVLVMSDYEEEYE